MAEEEASKESKQEPARTRPRKPWRGRKDVYEIGVKISKTSVSLTIDKKKRRRKRR